MASNVYKGQSLSESTLTGGVANTSGAFSWATTTIPTASGRFAVIFTPSDSTNYNSASLDILVTLIDKDNLTVLIEQAVSITNAVVTGEKNDQYPIAAYNAFAYAITVARNIANTPAASNTQASINNVYDTLQSAINIFNNFKIVVNYTELNAAVAHAITLKKGSYTDESWNVLLGAIANAEIMLARADVTQSEIDAALQVITDAQAVLQENQPLLQINVTTIVIVAGAIALLIAGVIVLSLLPRKRKTA